ncbi:MAG: HAMP domain-containing histidine kinase [Polyangiaceae bacterium]|nr:HAMP domain-containing histidine kinase [Polyangiaceae bacterium]MCW5790599.1 HAMP domain-containing histidine kinase [Polyangiaceae bacterium]
MTAAASRMTRRVLVWQALFSLGVTALLSLAASDLLLLGHAVVPKATRSIALLGLLGGGLALLRTWIGLRRHRFVLRALALGSRAIEPHELADLLKAPLRATLRWAAPHLVCFAALATNLRPALLDRTTGISLSLLCAVITAAASLPLLVLIRAALLPAIESAPPDVMAEVVEEAQHLGRVRPVPRRLIAAVATPVLFVALGSALIAGSHLRQSDEQSREETARAMARAALEPEPGLVRGAGLTEAIEAGQRAEFRARVSDERDNYRVQRVGDGVVQLTAPLDSGSARIYFEASTLPVVSLSALLISLAAALGAAAAGALLGRELLRDLSLATDGLRGLGTEALRSTPELGPARFNQVAELTSAISQLTERFHEFARAQERAIDAREAARRMRGLFFASVSHDLKSPLNAILGFTELVRQEPLTSGQLESLELIDRRGRELLALIETILDAARVEARQLSLVEADVPLGELIESARVKALDLGADHQAPIEIHVDEPARRLSVDPVRAARALATLIGHAVRTRDASEPVRVVARSSPTRICVDIYVPNAQATAAGLEALLDPSRAGATRQHRGLALGLGLVRSVIRLHGGSVRALTSPRGHPRIRVLLRAADAPAA